MKAVKLAGLQPEIVFGYFEQLCSMPHGSGNEKQISDYCVSFAKEHGLRYIQDELNNVILFKDGSAGYEDHPPLILQAHLDMVCQIDEGSGIDMETTPVDVTHDGTYVFAKRTSLGADDCAGVALALAVLADDTLAHPPIEAVFTVWEEAGMAGARNIDLSMLKGKRLLNIDTFREGVFTAGCAGSARVNLTVPVKREEKTVNTVKLFLNDLRGGHSGGMIKYNHANSNKTMAMLLKHLPEAELVSLAGGMSGNAIPRSCQAVIAVEPENVEQVKELCRSIREYLVSQGEENATLTAEECGVVEARVVSAEQTRKLVDYILDLPNGLQSWDPKFEGLPRTSLNMGILELREEGLYSLHHCRSSVNAEKHAIMEKLKSLAEEMGGTYSDTGVYSAWEYRDHSEFRDLMAELFREEYGWEPSVVMIHAGLECGVFSDKIPGLDCVSTGPNAEGCHTNKERMEISSMAKFWEYLKKLLEKM